MVEKLALGSLFLLNDFFVRIVRFLEIVVGGFWA